MAEKTVNLKIEDMTCDHCVDTVMSAASAVPGALAVDVSLADNQATIRYDDKLATVDDFTSALDSAGYGASAI